MYRVHRINRKIFYFDALSVAFLFNFKQYMSYKALHREVIHKLLLFL